MNARGSKGKKCHMERLTNDRNGGWRAVSYVVCRWSNR